MHLLKEPLLHFMVIGAVFFGGYALLNREKDPAFGMVVTSEQIEQLGETFSNDWNRPASAEELRNLVDDFVREELAFREGMAIGLDINDAVIRQRIRQKIETMTEDEAAKTQPTDDELKTYLSENADVFREPGRSSFYQVFLTRENEDQAVALLEELKTTDQHISEFGDSAPVGQHFAKVSNEEIDRAFGLGFWNQLLDLPEKSWSPPIESEQGIHLVYIEERFPGLVPDLGKIRYMVEFEWENEQRLQRLEKLYSNLWKKYAVRIEGQAE